MSASGPVFLHKGWRTGGTALTAALEALPQAYVLFDPFHELTGSPFGSLVESSSSTWVSNHPDGMKGYWHNHTPFVVDDRILGWRDEFAQTYFLPAGAQDPDRRSYLERFLTWVHAQGRESILCFETSDGRLGWLAKEFPNALQLCVRRPRAEQLRSWMQQAALGNLYFFRRAREIVVTNAEWFGIEEGTFDVPTEVMSSEALEMLFDCFVNRISAEQDSWGVAALTLDDVKNERTSPGIDALREHLGISRGDWHEVVRRVRETPTRQPSTGNFAAVIDHNVRLAADRQHWRERASQLQEELARSQERLGEYLTRPSLAAHVFIETLPIALKYRIGRKAKSPKG